MHLADIERLYDYNAWANGRVLDTVRALPAEQFLRPLGSSFSSLRDTLAHILGAEWVWLQRWRGISPPALPATTDFPDFAAVETRWRAVGSDLLGFVRGLYPADMERVLSYTNFRGEKFTYLLKHMLLHVVMHGNYHRGQITTMLRQLGAEPCMTDFLVYEDVLAGSARSF